MSIFCLLKANKEFVQQSAVPRRWDTHGGEDVPVYAQGVNSHLFRGVVEQTYIPYAISYASCIGPFKQMCLENQNRFIKHNNRRKQCLNYIEKLPEYSSNTIRNSSSFKFNQNALSLCFNLILFNIFMKFLNS